jgi:transcriptional regulator with XRE-family HTH domain
MNPVSHSPSTPDRFLIKALRAHFQMSQVDLASMSGVSLATISKIESGELENPRLETLNAIAKAFNINTAQLLFTETPEPGNFELAASLAVRKHTEG